MSTSSLPDTLRGSWEGTDTAGCGTRKFLRKLDPSADVLTKDHRCNFWNASPFLQAREGRSVCKQDQRPPRWPAVWGAGKARASSWGIPQTAAVSASRGLDALGRLCPSHWASCLGPQWGWAVSSTRCSLTGSHPGPKRGLARKACVCGSAECPQPALCLDASWDHPRSPSSSLRVCFSSWI